jgi:hypothetical protein
LGSHAVYRVNPPDDAVLELVITADESDTASDVLVLVPASYRHGRQLPLKFPPTALGAAGHRLPQRRIAEIVHELEPAAHDCPLWTTCQ